jgi:tetratricopeptide (TPR) repeat protein
MRVNERHAGRRKPGRNDPCPCGSGRKYKVCCGAASAPAGQTKSGPRRAASADPAGVQLLTAQAGRALKGGRTAEALSCLGQAVSLDPGNISLHLDLGRLLLNNGRPADALGCFKRVLEFDPDQVQAQLLEGLALEHLGWFEQAAEVYQRVIVRSPRLASAHSRLGTVLLLQDKPQEAAASFRRVAKLEPRKTEGLLGRALALVAEGPAEAARSALRDVLKRDPENVTALAQLGKLLAEAGKADEAWVAFERLLGINPGAVGHYYDLVRIRSLGKSDRPLLVRMQQALARGDLHPLQRVMLELAVGKAHDDLGDPEHAMGHYLAANRLKGQIRPLDRNLITERVDWLISTFTTELMASRREHTGSQDGTPLLVIGMPRSGTTLVESVLGSHSSVGTGQELSFWSRCGRDLEASARVPDGDKLSDIARSYLEVLRGISDAPHVTDKKPDNFFWAGLIHLVFPRARIIHCRRHPLDISVSILGNFFAPRPDFSTEPDDLVFYYREYQRLMTHWRTVLPPDCLLEVSYEELVESPEAVIRRLLAFSGLSWEDACLYPERSERSVSTASLWQVRQPIFTGSIGRWRNYRPWLEPIMPLLQSASDEDTRESR